MLLFIITTHDMHHHVFMYDERYKNTNSQINDSIKYIYQIQIEVGCKIKSIATR